MTAQKTDNRLNYLDALRAFALLLGIAFHASLSFTPIFIGWAVMDVSTSNIVSVLMLISHSFRMALFFLIAGFFSHMTFHKNGAVPFLKSRLTRIALPFLVGWFILRPLIVSGWVMGAQSLRGDVDILNGLIAGFQSLGTLPTDLLTGSHLWFLYYLILVTTITLLFRSLLNRSPKTHRTLANASDSFVAWLSESRFTLILLSLPTALCLWHMNHWGMDTPDKSLMPHLPVLIVYTGFFAFGWLLHRSKNAIEHIARPSVARILLCLLSIAATVKLSVYQGDLGNPQYAIIRAAFAFSYALMMWTLITLAIGFFKRFFDTPSKRIRYIADASYWLYLLHLPIVVWLQVAFAELPLHWTLKLTAISAITIAFSLLTYDLFVRSTVLGKILNGRPKPRLLPLTRRGLARRRPRNQIPPTLKTLK